MTLALIVYFAGVLSSLHNVLVILGIICGIAVIIAVGCGLDTGDEHAIKFAKRVGIIGLIIVFTCVAIPSERTMYIMAGAYATQKVAENPEVQKLSGKVLTLIEQKLDDLVEEGVKKAGSKK